MDGSNNQALQITSLDLLRKKFDELKHPEEIRAFLLIDIDDFWYINKSFGPEVGDLMVSRLCQLIRGIFKTNHDLVRVDCDAFLLYFNEDLGDLQRKVNRLLKKASRILVDQRKNRYLSISIGISTFQDHGNTFNELLHCADMALREAQQKNKGGMKYFDRSVEFKLIRRLTIEYELKKALEEKKLEIFYQPILDGNTLKAKGYEALLRWHHLSSGSISPLEFISVAEDCGLMPSIEQWLFEEVFFQSHTITKGRNDIFIAINLSAKGLLKNNLSSILKKLMIRYDYPAENIVLEATESQLFINEPTSTKELKKLVALGVKIALDDFGTGYSSIDHIRKIPVEKLKIDRSFINDLLKNTKSKQLVKGIIEMAHSLDLKVVAEGIEHQKQGELLQEMNCDYFQGYYYGKPTALEKLE